ncbi:haloacid dehalogenase-like hydrolase [Aestuariivirga litoralis]|uniref:Haloacid dehalogenase-like hydrolase n=1 Tax=Aestuariivirga litoralis TaxID=2650924 RepID=A0A2W2BXZ0_9HYPH|nr:HAD family hydrolase [Aestuariivirga litoralis]PZF78316.1 haloacid dehalogenase-like hydrolase [Aestuariivirga litoralis]
MIRHFSWGRQYLWVQFAALLLVLLTAGHARADDPLPSWNEGAAKSAIIGYVTKVTRQGTPDFVPEGERVAVFDNDGTLWPENPMPFQMAYAIDVAKQLAATDPKIAANPMVKALIADDWATLMAAPHHQGFLEIVALTHAGTTVDEFRQSVEAWMKTATHPRFKRRYDQLTYQPMQEVLAYFRANGFKTFIVSGGGADFMRVWSERVYGIPPAQVVGSTTRVVYELRDSGPVLVKTMDNLVVDDKAGKPAGIHAYIGQRPIAVFGNSDGDKEMLEYGTIANPLPSLGVIVHHTDAEREYQYDVNPKSSGTLVEALKEAPQRGWTVVSMKDDWKTIFAPE